MGSILSDQKSGAVLRVASDGIEKGRSCRYIFGENDLLVSQDLTPIDTVILVQNRFSAHVRCERENSTIDGFHVSHIPAKDC